MNSPDMSPLAPLLTVRETADLLRISERTLFTLTKSGEIPTIRIGRGVRYDERDLAEWVNRKSSLINAIQPIAVRCKR
jgi:excisionase family DNA binding protein